MQHKAAACDVIVYNDLVNFAMTIKSNLRQNQQTAQAVEELLWYVVKIAFSTLKSDLLKLVAY